jgi:transcription factor TFIIIB component B''
VNEETSEFPFNIDINSLVLVESQDTENPDKPIFEIYAVDQETGKLGDKPLDLSHEDVEMIRSLMEENGEEED